MEAAGCDACSRDWMGCSASGTPVVGRFRGPKVAVAIHWIRLDSRLLGTTRAPVCSNAKRGLLIPVQPQKPVRFEAGVDRKSSESTIF